MLSELMQTNGNNRLNPIFFYGLYMDADRLRSMGVEPRQPLTGCVNDYKVRLGRRGSLLRRAGGITWGVVFHLTHAEINRLYPEAGLTDYVPEVVKVNLANGQSIAALTYVTLNPAHEDELNLAYVVKLADILMGHCCK
jgi:cation transport regulator ChaC